MKRPLIAAVALLSLAGAAHAAPLTVNLQGIEDRGGKLYISVQTADQFMKDEGTAGVIIDSPEAGAYSATYDVPAGHYAVSIWHDDNGNGEFDTGGQYGMPLDGWAMHNSSKLTGPPTFDLVSVEVTSAGATVSEKITYGR